MKIMKKSPDFEPGTLILTEDGYVKLTSAYSSFSGCYDAVKCNIDEDGEIIEGEEIRVSPKELVGGEIQ